MSSYRTFLLGVIVFLLCYLSVFEVYEGEYALVIPRLAPYAWTLVGPGWHLTWPLFNKIQRLDFRIQTIEVDSLGLKTADNQSIWIDYGLSWKIQDEKLFYQKTAGVVKNAQGPLINRINQLLNQELAQKDLAAIIRTGSNLDPVFELAQAYARSLGIDLLSLNIIRIQWSSDLDRLIKQNIEQEELALITQYQSEAQFQADLIKKDADAQAALVLSRAQEQATELRAQGEAQAAKIYAQAYAQNPKFFIFYRSLSAYQKIFADQPRSVLILGIDAPFLKNLDVHKENS